MKGTNHFRTKWAKILSQTKKIFDLPTSIFPFSIKCIQRRTIHKTIQFWFSWSLDVLFSSLVISSSLVLSFIFSFITCLLSPLSSLLSLRLVLSCLPLFVLSCLLLSSVFSSLSVSVFFLFSLPLYILCLRVVLWSCCCGVVWCGVSCCVLLSCDAVWCVGCVRPKRPRVYLHHADMLKHTCAWCRDVLNVRTVCMGEERGCRRPRVLHRNTRDFWTCWAAP